MSAKEDFVEILLTGISLKEFGFDDRSIRVFTKIMASVLSDNLPHLKIYRENTTIFYEGGTLFLRLTPNKVEFRTIEGGLSDIDKSNAGRFCIAAIKFVAEASMSLNVGFDDFSEEDTEEIFRPRTTVKKKLEPPPPRKTTEEDDSEDWWL